MFETSRLVVLGASLLGVEGPLQREGLVIHVVAQRLVDLSVCSARSAIVIASTHRWPGPITSRPTAMIHATPAAGHDGRDTDRGTFIESKAFESGSISEGHARMGVTHFLCYVVGNRSLWQPAGVFRTQHARVG